MELACRCCPVPVFGLRNKNGVPLQLIFLSCGQLPKSTRYLHHVGDDRIQIGVTAIIDDLHQL